jgi:hypothetical protein
MIAARVGRPPGPNPAAGTKRIYSLRRNIQRHSAAPGNTRFAELPSKDANSLGAAGRGARLQNLHPRFKSGRRLQINQGLFRAHR